MTRSRPIESLVSALVILLIALVLLLARATAHGCSAVPPTCTTAQHTGITPAATPTAGSPGTALGEYAP
jgi:hypothetical protein